METVARRELALALTRADCALIVEGLAERPFREVFELIGMLHAGAEPHVTCNAAQLRLILDTLGGMPFARVCSLLQSMHRQMRADRH